MVKAKGRKKFSKETRRKMSEARSGENNSMFGKKLSKETRRKLRISTINYIETSSDNGEPISPRTGTNETKILNEFEKLYGYKIEREFRCIGYFPDGYIRELNLCIEVDEAHHFDCDGNLRKEDIERQKNIEEELGCKFLRIPDYPRCGYKYPAELLLRI